ncbi:MAG: efflux RND transporter periplasmic adaptor subunit [Rhabdochlamydiaceae bacterium]|nr:efflux RND transporter periplasmic adaptor subunit [Candidatus Amphrikana amoebophyrae]
MLTISICSCKKQQPQQKISIPVTAIKVETHTIPANFEFVGVGKSSHIVELRARVEGYLESIDYQEGTKVSAGEKMFVLDQRPFIAEVNSKKGDLERQQALLWNADQILNRMIPLYEENAISQKDLDDAIADKYAAQANVATAQANLESARLNLGFATISAPVTGMASNAKYREGALINPGQQNLLTNIYVIDPIWVYFSVSEGDILKARYEVSKNELKYPKDMNFKIEVVMADNSVFPAEGKIDFTDPALQQETGTMLVRAILPNPKGWIRPGQFVRVVVKGATRPNAIIVPQSAVLQGQKGLFVYVINSSNQTELRPVETGDWYEDYWIILKGLKAGDVVVAEGVNRVRNGTEVKVMSYKPSLPKINDSRRESELESLGM